MAIILKIIKYINNMKNTWKGIRSIISSRRKRQMIHQKQLANLEDYTVTDP